MFQFTYSLVVVMIFNNRNVGHQADPSLHQSLLTSSSPACSWGRGATPTLTKVTEGGSLAPKGSITSPTSRSQLTSHRHAASLGNSVSSPTPSDHHV